MAKTAIRYVLLIAFALIGFGRPSYALLLSANDSIFGMGSLTQDTNTGLEWLDVDLSLNLSVNDVLSGSGGYVANGFRYATEIEVRQLWTNAGISVFNTNAATPGADPAGRVPENLAGVEFLMGLVGCTGNCTSAGPDFTQGKAALDEAGPSTAQSPFIEFFGPNARAWVGADVCCADLDSKQPSAGNWLVRVMEVPEPSTLTLLCFGLAGLGYTCRKS